jgi:OmpA-OmpF porin, OOP family
MIKSGQSLILWIAAPVVLALATTGCATKSYVRNQVAPVNHSVAALKTDTNQKIAYVNNKETTDISAVNERIDTTDQKVAQVASATQEAQGTASRAMETAEGNTGKIAANAEAITTLGKGVANALNYQLVEKGDVTFGFNKATLTPEAKSELDKIAAKVQSLPRSEVELAGFTDRVGTQNYNLALSRRRAEAVQRYLVAQKVPLMAIHIVGLGEEGPPEHLGAYGESHPSGSKARDREARRVHIRVFGAGDITSPGEDQ